MLKDQLGEAARTFVDVLWDLEGLGEGVDAKTTKKHRMLTRTAMSDSTVRPGNQGAEVFHFACRKNGCRALVQKVSTVFFVLWPCQRERFAFVPQKLRRQGKHGLVKYPVV